MAAVMLTFALVSAMWAVVSPIIGPMGLRVSAVRAAQRPLRTLAMVTLPTSEASTGFSNEV